MLLFDLQCHKTFSVTRPSLPFSNSSEFLLQPTTQPPSSLCSWRHISKIRKNFKNWSSEISISRWNASSAVPASPIRSLLTLGRPFKVGSVTRIIYTNPARSGHRNAEISRSDTSAKNRSKVQTFRTDSIRVPRSRWCLPRVLRSSRSHRRYTLYTQM